MLVSQNRLFLEAVPLGRAGALVSVSMVRPAAAVAVLLLALATAALAGTSDGASSCTAPWTLRRMRPALKAAKLQVRWVGVDGQTTLSTLLGHHGSAVVLLRCSAPSHCWRTSLVLH